MINLPSHPGEPEIKTNDSNFLTIETARLPVQLGQPGQQVRLGAGRAGQQCYCVGSAQCGLSGQLICHPVQSYTTENIIIAPAVNISGIMASCHLRGDCTLSWPAQNTTQCRAVTLPSIPGINIRTIPVSISGILFMQWSLQYDWYHQYTDLPFTAFLWLDKRTEKPKKTKKQYFKKILYAKTDDPLLKVNEFCSLMIYKQLSARIYLNSLLKMQWYQIFIDKQ